jgi:hypothetical protein
MKEPTEKDLGGLFVGELEKGTWESNSKPEPQA